MPTKPTPQVTSWSFSSLTDYDNCPFKLKLKRVDCLKEPPSPQMDEGNRVHKLAEDYVLGKLARLPKELKLFAEEFKALRKQKGVEAEAEWCFDSAWTPTGWFAPNAWVRIKVDAHYLDPKTNRIRVIDYKTGKIRDKDREQLSLYALAAMLLYPDAEGVDAELWYLKHGELIAENFERDEGERRGAGVVRMRKAWEKRVKPMLADRKFKPTPNALCRYCHFRKENGGPCKF